MGFRAGCGWFQRRKRLTACTDGGYPPLCSNPNCGKQASCPVQASPKILITWRLEPKILYHKALEAHFRVLPALSYCIVARGRKEPLQVLWRVSKVDMFSNETRLTLMKIMQQGREMICNDLGRGQTMRLRRGRWAMRQPAMTVVPPLRGCGFIFRAFPGLRCACPGLSSFRPYGTPHESFLLTRPHAEARG
jgi:hypothetical protein